VDIGEWRNGNDEGNYASERERSGYGSRNLQRACDCDVTWSAKFADVDTGDDGDNGCGTEQHVDGDAERDGIQRGGGRNGSGVAEFDDWRFSGECGTVHSNGGSGVDDFERGFGNDFRCDTSRREHQRTGGGKLYGTCDYDRGGDDEFADVGDSDAGGNSGANKFAERESDERGVWQHQSCKQQYEDCDADEFRNRKRDDFFD